MQKGEDRRVGKGKQGEASTFSKMETTGRLFCSVERFHFITQVCLKLAVQPKVATSSCQTFCLCRDYR